MGEMIPNLYKIRWGKRRVKILGGVNDQRNVTIKYSIVGVIKRQRRKGTVVGSVIVGMD